MGTFGTRENDSPKDSAGNVLADLKQTFYASRADAEAQTNPLGSATTGKDGRFSFSVDGKISAFGRDPFGVIRPYDTEDIGSAASSTYAAVKSVNGAAYGNGTTDATAHIQSVIDEANAANVGVYVPAGEYKLTAPLENVRRLHLAHRARLFAGAPGMAAVVRTQATTRWDNGWIEGEGSIDAGTNADIALHLRNFLYFKVDGLQLLGGNVAALKLGDAGAAGRAAEAVVSRLRIFNAGNVVAGSRGILVENSGDHSVSQVLIMNYETGVELPAGGNGIFHDVHVWTEPAKGATKTAFLDRSNNSHYTACHADTPSQYGWRLYGYQTTLVQCGTYNNPTAGNMVDNAVVGVKFEGANAIGTIVGHYFMGGGASARLAYDVQAADGKYGLIQTLGCSYQFVTNLRSSRSSLIGLDARDAIKSGQAVQVDTAAPSNTAGLQVKVNGLDRWALITDGAAETGANAGSSIRLVRYDDSGALLGEVFYVARTGTWVQKSSMLMGPGANLIPDSAGTKLGTAATQKWGFWGAPPVTQPQTSGVTAGFTAGAGTAVDHAATFTGNWGSTAYTISDIVSNLKQAGILKS